MKVPFYGHVRQYESIKSEIDAKMAEVIQSGQYVQGPMLKKFEQELAAYAGAQYAVGVGNGTDALWLTFMSLGLGPGDRITIASRGFFYKTDSRKRGPRAWRRFSGSFCSTSGVESQCSLIWEGNSTKSRAVEVPLCEG